MKTHQYSQRAGGPSFVFISVGSPIIGISAVKSHSRLLTTNATSKINIEESLWEKTRDKHRMEMSVECSQSRCRGLIRATDADTNRKPEKMKTQARTLLDGIEIFRGPQEQLELSRLSPDEIQR